VHELCSIQLDLDWLSLSRILRSRLRCNEIPGMMSWMTLPQSMADPISKFSAASSFFLDSPTFGFRVSTSS
jgi:hypothetical protein